MMEDQRPTSKELLCPSVKCTIGAFLLGTIGADGRVGYINPAPRVDEEFVELSRQGRTPEHRFRFAAACAQAACDHWTHAKCGVVDHAISAAKTLEHDATSQDTLPRCAIRAECRWFAQRKRDACFVCPLVFNYSRRDSTSQKGNTDDQAAG